jgi:hypothetical protein
MGGEREGGVLAAPFKLAGLVPHHHFRESVEHLE